MKPKSQQIPVVEIDIGSDLETARQIVSGIDQFVLLLKTAHEKGTAKRRSGSFSDLLVLVEQCLSIDNALPSGFRMALRATVEDEWKKPLQRLKMEIDAWHPTGGEKFERPIPAIWDRDESLKVWDEEEVRNRNSDASMKEQRAIDAIADGLSSLFQMLAQMSQAAELRLLGRPSDQSPRKKEAARSITDARLRDDYFRNQWLIEFLRQAIDKDDCAALRLAKQHFGRNKRVHPTNAC